jgi:hypothetical protein
LAWPELVTGDRRQLTLCATGHGTVSILNPRRDVLGDAVLHAVPALVPQDCERARGTSKISASRATKAGLRRNPLRLRQDRREREGDSSVTTEPLSDDELTELAELAEHATPGPWYVRDLDDEHAMSLVAVSTQPDTERGERWPDFDHTAMIAATLIQQPRYVDIADERWGANAAFIAAARTAVPRLLEEITRLRKLLEATMEGR